MTENIFLIPLKQSSIEIYKNKLPRSNKILLFDIDDTLYCKSTGLTNLMFKKIHEFGLKLDIPEDQLTGILKEFNSKYHLSVKGYMKHFPNADLSEFNQKVLNELEVEGYVKPDIELRNILQKIDLKFYCLTNSNEVHAIRVLKALGIDDLFSGVFYCEYNKTGDFICKPDDMVLDIVEKCLGNNTYYFFDDLAKNLLAARKRGWQTFLVNVENNIKTILSRYLLNNNMDRSNRENLDETNSSSIENTQEDKIEKFDAHSFL